MFQHLKDRPRLPRRQGFTLVEILVVLGIIVILIGISIGVAGNAMRNARIARTMATIKKVNLAIQNRVSAFNRVKLDAQSRRAQIFFNVNSSLASIISHKVAYQGLLPQRQVDLYGLDQVAGGEVDAPIKDLYARLQTTPANHRPITESSELLYLALTQASAFGVEPVNEDEFTGDVADTDNDGLLEFVDGWGQPLRFYRWPTRLFRPAAVGSETTPQSVTGSGTLASQRYSHWINPNWNFSGGGAPVPPKTGPAGMNARILMRPLPTAQLGVVPVRNSSATRKQEILDPLSKDADDPLSTFANWANTVTPSAEARYHTPDTYHLPLVISTGPDGILGIYEPFETAYFGHLAQPRWDSVLNIADNISNRTIQTGLN